MELKEMRARVEKIEELQAELNELNAFINRVKEFDLATEQICIIRNGIYTTYRKSGKVVDILFGDSGITSKAHILQIAELTLKGLLKEIEELQK